jgi:excisionase family DNA binding protein
MAVGKSPNQGKIGDLLTTTEASHILDVTRRHVWWLCRQHEQDNSLGLPGLKVGRDYLIPRDAVESYERKPPGRRPSHSFAGV